MLQSWDLSRVSLANPEGSALFIVSVTGTAATQAMVIGTYLQHLSMTSLVISGLTPSCMRIYSVSSGTDLSPLYTDLNRSSPPSVMLLTFLKPEETHSLSISSAPPLGTVITMLSIYPFSSKALIVCHITGFPFRSMNCFFSAACILVPRPAAIISAVYLGLSASIYPSAQKSICRKLQIGHGVKAFIIPPSRQEIIVSGRRYHRRIISTVHRLRIDASEPGLITFILHRLP